MENIFITALVRAGLCSQHRTDHSSWTGSCHHSSISSLYRQYTSKAVSKCAHAFHSKSPSQILALPVAEQPTEEDPIHFLDIYIRQDQIEERPSFLTETNDLPALEAPKSRRVDDADNSSTIKPFMSEREEKLVEEIRKMIEVESENQQEIYEAYRSLPHPRIVYLSRNLRKRLLLKLSVLERKTLIGMQQYISVLEDVRTAGLHIFLSQWNSAIHLVGRHLVRVSADDAEAAVSLYKEMEHAGIEGNHVTFNILFDIAVKAGDFSFAEVILSEMKVRKLEISRYGSVGLIYYQGRRHDGQGVRDAYIELVKRGQIVDTVVLNCVIVSLLNSGERAAAEQVYYRMRKISEEKGCVFEHQSFQDKRTIARVLSKADKALRHSPEAFKHLQDDQLRLPNLGTFHILLRYHVEVTGELQAVTAVLDDMGVMGVPAYELIYRDIFKGFANHGGVPYTAWTKPRLERIWKSFMIAVSAGDDITCLGKWSVIWVIRAFNKCSGYEAALAKWEVMKKQWSPTEEEAEIIHGILSHHEHLQQKGRM